MAVIWTSLLFGTAMCAVANAELLPATELITSCYSFPQDSFDLANSVRGTYGSSPHMMLDIGSSAIDFTLHDIDGIPWNLGGALRASNGKPVVLIWGMATCPAYQGLDSDESSAQWAYWDEHALVESHGDKAVFVHMYGPEPHPTSPDTNFDSGMLLTQYWSTYRQPLTYDERVQAAKKIRPITHPEQTILPDYLPDNPHNSLSQPVWCSYANGARPAIMVTSSGTIFFQQTWFKADELADAIDSYWEQEGEGIYSRVGDDTGPKSRLKTGKRSAKKGLAAKPERKRDQQP